MDYSIESLVDFFGKYAKISDEIQKKNIRDFQDNDPDSEIPEYLQFDFNINLALQSICKEIVVLSNYLERFPVADGNPEG
jgi:hypothetical protein